MTESRPRVAAHGRLVAVDGVNDLAVRNTARVVVARIPHEKRGGVSSWDASGIFGDLLVAGEEAGLPSARTLLLLYAADLAFRLRWEIRPALEQGKSVVVAPYVATAVSFGKAAGLDAKWLANLFAFAPKPAESRGVDAAPERNAAERRGFVELACQTVSGGRASTRRDLLARAHASFARKR